MDAKRILFSVETSTPKARALTEALMNAGALANTGFTLTSREVRAIVSGAPVETVTKPMSEPFPDVVQDLWQLSLAISAVIGVTAGLSTADDAGRRYIVGVAAAVQLAIFPVWLGAATVIGIPDGETLVQHLFSFSINIATIAAASVAAYALAHSRPS